MRPGNVPDFNVNTSIPITRLLLLNKLLEDGNILYRKNRLQEAAHRYQYALRKIPATAAFAEHAGTFLQLRVNFLLNHSRCKRKMNVSADRRVSRGSVVESVINCSFRFAGIC